jgi:hypothetical protein
MSSLGWGQGTWGNNQWGGFENVTVSVTGTGLTASLGTIPAVHSNAPLPIFLGWGEGGWNQNRWGGRVSTAFGVVDDGFGLTASLGSVTVTGTGSVSLTGVNATTTLDFDPTTDINIPISFAVTGLGATSALGNETAFTNVAVAVTQSQISSNIGTVDFDGDANVPVTGLQGSAGLGTEGPTIVANLSFSVTGFGLTATLGEENAAAQTKVFPTTVVGTGAVGNPTILGAANFSVTGSTGTGAVGNTTLVGSGNAIGSFGSNSVGAVGTTTVIPSIEVNATGVAGTGGIGDALAAGGAKVVEDAITGTVNLGDEAVRAGANVFPTGVSCESLLGDTRTGTASDGSGTGTDIIFTVTVVGGNPTDHPYYNVFGASSNKYAINGSTATAAVTLTLEEGKTYRFDQSDSSNDGHPLRFSTTPNGTHSVPAGGGTEYTTGVTAIGTPGQAGAYTEITVSDDSPTLYYYCTNHSGMGWQANTFNSTVNVIGNSTVIPTGVSATNSIGEEGVGLLLTISLTGTGLSGTTGLGTLAITGGSVVVSTGVSATGSTGEEQVYDIIKPTQVANWTEKAA